MPQIIEFALASTLAVGAGAQQAEQPSVADPNAAVPAYRYESVFKDYRPYAEPEVARWRDANEEVGRIGGHMGHARKAVPERKSTPEPAAQPLHGTHK